MVKNYKNKFCCQIFLYFLFVCQIRILSKLYFLLKEQILIDEDLILFVNEPKPQFKKELKIVETEEVGSGNYDGTKKTREEN